MTTTMRRSRGMTLLEVMIATAVLAVGTVSVLMVFGTALSFAHRRQGQQRLTQVVSEARSDARSMVNSFRAPKAGAAPAPAPKRDKGKDKGKGKSAVVDNPTPAGNGPDTDPRQSSVFAAYSYQLHFEPVRPDLPDAGWRTTLTVRWGDGEEYSETHVFISDVIPEEEFKYSMTYEEERQGEGDTKGTRETR